MAKAVNAVKQEKSMKKPTMSVSMSEDVYGESTAITLQGDLTKRFKDASEMGYDSVEIQLHTPSLYDPENLLSLAEQYNLSVSAIGTGLESAINGLFFTSEDEEIRMKTRQRFFEHIDLAAHFGSVVFLGLCRGKAPSSSEIAAYLDTLASELIPIAEYAEKKNVVLAFEPIVFYMTNLLNTTMESLEFLERPGLEAIQLLLDTHHMYIEDKDMFESFKAAAPRTAHVHISDSNRQYAGSGNVDFDKVGKVLKEINYSKSVSLECLPLPSGEEAALRTIRWMKQVWN